MAFHLSAFFQNLGVAAANTNLPFNIEETFIRSQNSGLIVTEKYRLLMAYYLATSATDARFDSSTLGAVGRPHIFPVRRALTIQDIPVPTDFRDYPVWLPINEEIQLQGSNNLGAATEASNGLIWIGSENWNKSLPRGIQRQIVHCLATVTTVANVWTQTPAAVFDENLRGGVYAVVGMCVQEANMLGVRINFPTAPTINNRKFKPGCMASNALAERPWPGFFGDMGEWGRFSTFDGLSFEFYANDAAAHASDIFLDTIYLGQDRNLVFGAQ